MERERKVIGRAALVDALRASSAFLRKVERLQLLTPVGRTSRRESYYPAEVLERLSHVQSLLAAGYAEKDIGHVLGRVVAEAGQEAELVCSATEIDAPAEVIASLLERDLLPVWGLTTGGERLFAVSELRRVRVIVALEALGLGEFVTVSSRGPTAELEARVAALEAQFGVIKDWLASRVGKGGRSGKKVKPKKAIAMGLFSRRRPVPERSE